LDSRRRAYPVLLTYEKNGCACNNDIELLSEVRMPFMRMILLPSMDHAHRVPSTACS
jgi:hypothetical protein